MCPLGINKHCLLYLDISDQPLLFSSGPASCSQNPKRFCLPKLPLKLFISASRLGHSSSPKINGPFVQLFKPHGETPPPPHKGQSLPRLQYSPWISSRGLGPYMAKTRKNVSLNFLMVVLLLLLLRLLLLLLPLLSEYSNCIDAESFDDM